MVKVGDTLSRLNGQLDQSAREVKALRALADALGEPVPELRLVEAKVADLQAEIMSDPLLVADGFDKEILPAIAARAPASCRSSGRARPAGHRHRRRRALIVSLEEALAQAKTAYNERCAQSDGRQRRQPAQSVLRLRH